MEIWGYYHTFLQSTKGKRGGVKKKYYKICIIVYTTLDTPSVEHVAVPLALWQSDRAVFKPDYAPFGKKRGVSHKFSDIIVQNEAVNGFFSIGVTILTFWNHMTS